MRIEVQILDARNIANIIMGKAKSFNDPLAAQELTQLLLDWKYGTKDDKHSISVAAKRTATRKHL